MLTLKLHFPQPSAQLGYSGASTNDPYGSSLVVPVLVILAVEELSGASTNNPCELGGTVASVPRWDQYQ